MNRWLTDAKTRAQGWLQQGLTPRQLACTLALGFAIGCVPLFGVTTAICTLVALTLRLNMPAIQAANWVAMPFQLFLLVPFLRLGQWIFGAPAANFSREQLVSRMTSSPIQVAGQMGGMLGHAILAWLVTAGPACLLLALALSLIFARLPRLSPAPAPSGD